MKQRLMFWVVPFFVAVFMFIFFQRFMFVGYVPSASMEPAIKKGSYILGVRKPASLKPGDIVVFIKDGEYLVKRIAAVPDQIIAINDSKPKPAAISLDKCHLEETRTFTVPPDRYFMLGDNRSQSDDSRFWDEPFIAKDQIIAKFLFGF